MHDVYDTGTMATKAGKSSQEVGGVCWYADDVSCGQRVTGEVIVDPERAGGRQRNSEAGRLTLS